MQAMAVSPRDGRRGYSLAEVVIALGVAATGLAGGLSAVSVAMSASRDAAAITGAMTLARTALASPDEMAVGKKRVLFADACAGEIRGAPFGGAFFRMEIVPCDPQLAGRPIPVCLTISWPPHDWNRVRLMTALAAVRREGPR